MQVQTTRFSTAIKVQAALWVTIVLWSSAYVFIRIGLQSFNPGALGFFRYVIASICMFILYACLPHKNRLSLLQILHLMGLGVLGIGCYNVLLNFGELTVKSGIAAFIVGMMPVFTILFAMVLLGERIAPKSWIGIGVSILGMLFIAMGESDVGFDYGVIFILIAAILGSYYTVGQKPLLKCLHPLEVAMWAIVGGTLSMAVFTPTLIHDLHHASKEAIFAAIYLGIFPAAIGYTTWSFALSHCPTFKAALYLYLAPVMTTLLAIILLQEFPSQVAFLGGLIALIGAALSNHFYFSLKNHVTPKPIVNNLCEITKE